MNAFFQVVIEKSFVYSFLIKKLWINEVSYFNLKWVPNAGFLYQGSMERAKGRIPWLSQNFTCSNHNYMNSRVQVIKGTVGDILEWSTKKKTLFSKCIKLQVDWYLAEYQTNNLLDKICQRYFTYQQIDLAKIGKTCR